MISILTPSIPERAAMLAECKRSVAAQGPVRYEHLIHVDEERRGCSWVMNHLAEQAAGEWLLPLADDDLLLPGALEVLLLHTGHGDVIYSPPLVWGNGDGHFWGDPPCIPSFALIRAELWRALGGYDEGASREEDRQFWIKAMVAGACFYRADEAPTWVYRFHRGNKSYNGGRAS